MHKSLAVMGLMLSLNAFAADYQEGKHYYLLSNPVAVADKSKIEVVELFSYDCLTCDNFESVINPWKANQADDVVIRLMPALWNPQQEPWVRGYYTALVLGIVDKTHSTVFTYKEPLNTADEWANFYANFGKTREEILKAYNSFEVTSYVAQAKNRLMNNYKAERIPELYIQGKYRIPRGDQSDHQMLSIADFLIAEERKNLQK